VGITNWGLDEIMDAVMTCERLERLDLSGLDSDAFDDRHALCLPPTIREVRLDRVCLSGVDVDMWDADMGRLFTNIEWLVDVRKYYIDINGIMAWQCPLLNPVWHTGLLPFMGTIARQGDDGLHRECVTCGCTREFDDEDERVCWCDLCAAHGCDFMVCERNK
jgi:hypothetical protein